MMRYRCLSLICALFMLVPVVPMSRAQTVQPAVVLAERAVSMELVETNLSPAQWPAEPVTLTTETVVTKPKDKLFNLLVQRGIRPDVEALTLVYDLNPDLEKVTELPPGLTLKLPKVAAGAQLQRAFQSGRIVMLTVDERLKKELGADVRMIQILAACFANLEPGRFADPKGRAQAISSVQDLTAWLAHIRKSLAQRTAKPLRQVTLLQIHDEAAVLRAIMEQALTPEQKLSAEDQRQIQLIHADIKKAIQRWDEKMAGELPEGEPHYKVTVEIVGGKPEVVKTLRVYFATWGLFRDPLTNPPIRSNSFDGLGQGATKMLPIKDYKVWAAYDGQHLNPLTTPVDLEVRQPPEGNTLKVSLVMK